MQPLQTNIVLFNNSFPSLKSELSDSIDEQMRDAVLSVTVEVKGCLQACRYFQT
jgi:hypothetical protein